MELLRSQDSPISSETAIHHSSFQECPTLALEICGQEWKIGDLMREIEKEREVMEGSGGGVTISGGEPLMQKELSLMLEELGKRCIHRCLDTTLHAAADVVRSVADKTDLFLVDVKVMDAAQHKRFTGVGNELILSNIRLLAELGADFIVRIPLIEGVNADEDNIRQTARFLARLPWSRREVNLLPYHELGRDKHRRLASAYNASQLPMKKPDDATMKRCIAQFEELGIHAKVGG